MTSPDLEDVGRALIRLGRRIRDNKETGLTPDTLALFIELSSQIPDQIEDHPDKWTEEKDPLGALILNWVRTGEAIPPGTASKDITNALTRLRRNGYIVNDGTRKDPRWRTTSSEEQRKIQLSGRQRRNNYEKERASNA